MESRKELVPQLITSIYLNGKRKQQIRQIPVFLGRRKRSSAGDQEEEEAGLTSNGNGLVTLDEISHETRDEDVAGQTAGDERLVKPDGSRMEEIKFLLNGKEERYVVAKEVEAVVDLSSPDDTDFGL